MPPLLTNNIFFKLLSHADTVSQLIFWFLMGMSVICWWIWIFKLYNLSSKARQAQYALDQVQKMKTPRDLARLGMRLNNTIASPLISDTLATLGHAFVQAPFAVDHVPSEHEQELIRMTLDHTLINIIKKEEKHISILKLSAETGPLIGLFGTVWGLIHAFNRISDRQIADIPTVAPGIAEALIITLTGLIVAIPALVMYYTLMQRIRHLEDSLSIFAQKIEWMLNTPHTVQSTLQSHETPLSQSAS